ncbi:MAG: hypothetical protein QM724_13830 [Flavobacteriales bacterium]
MGTGSGKNSSPHDRRRSMSGGADPGPIEFLKKAPQKWELATGALVATALFGMAWWCYPMAMATADTPNYVQCAKTHDYGGYRPIGFSWLLEFAHLFSTAFNAVSVLQFLLYAGGALFFAFSVKRFFPPRRPWMFRLMLGLMLLAPAPMYMARWNLSDLLNLALTLIWLASLLWCIGHRPTVPMVLLHVVTLYLAMKVRYASLVLPLISVIGILMRVGFRKGWWLAALMVFPALVVVVQGRMDNERLLHIKVFSGFTGWAQANNASAIIPYIRGQKETFRDPDLAFVHERLLAFGDSCYRFDQVSGTHFIWRSGWPGKTVMNDLHRADPRRGYVQNWVYTGTCLGRYAAELRWHHPLLYARHFLLPNACALFIPPNDIPSYPATAVDRYSKEWFHLSEGTYGCRYDAYHLLISAVDRRVYQGLLLLSIIALVAWWLLRGQRTARPVQRSLIVMMLLYIGASFGFLVVAHPVLFRYVAGYGAIFLSLLYMLATTWPAPGMGMRPEDRAKGSTA